MLSSGCNRCPDDRRPALFVDEHTARQVAECLLTSANATQDPVVRAAYDQLERQTDSLLHHLHVGWPGTLHIAATRLTTPYDNHRELVDAVRRTNTLEIPAVEGGRTHPLLGGQPGDPYGRFRALHDLLGHVVPGFGFDRDGEYSAWRSQHLHYRGLARWALATELHAQHSVRWTTGELAELKAVLIDCRLLQRSLSASPRERRGPCSGSWPSRRCHTSTTCSVHDGWPAGDDAHLAESRFENWPVTPSPEGIDSDEDRGR